MSKFKTYKRTNKAQIRPLDRHEILTEKLPINVSVSQSDKENGSPKAGDVIARNPKNHDDQWLINEKYFKENFRKENIRDKIFEQVINERNRQQDKWGVQNHTPIEWCAILGEEVGEVQKAALETHFDYPKSTIDDYKKELIQVIAVGLSMLECLERKQN